MYIWQLVLILMIPVIAFLAWCRAADRTAAERPSQYGDGSESIVFVIRRLIWKHVKLALYMCGGFLLAMFSLKGASEKNEGLNQPVTSLLQVIAGLLAPIVLVVGIYFSYMYDEHKVILNLMLIAVYLIWLYATAFETVCEEYHYKAGTKILRKPTRYDVWGYSKKHPILQRSHVPADVREDIENALKNQADSSSLRWVKQQMWMSFDKDFADGLYDSENHPREWGFPEEYTDKERKSFRRLVLVPCLLVLALVSWQVPSWHGAADQPCYHGCTAEEARVERDKVWAEEERDKMPIHEAIGRYELRGKVTIYHGEPQGISLDSNCENGQIPDGTYTVERVDGAGGSSEQGTYLQFYRSSFLGIGVGDMVTVCTDMRP